MTEIEIRDQNAAVYDSVYAEKGRWHDWVEKKVVLRALRPSTDDVILDAGCGTGRITAELGCRVYALDYSAKSIEILRSKHLAGVTALVRDILEPIDVEADKAVSVQTIQHVKYPIIALQNMRVCLKDGGVCVISVYNADHFFLGKIVGKKLQRSGYFPNGLPFHRFRACELKWLMEEAGFHDVTVVGCVNVSDYSLMNAFMFYPVALLDSILSRYAVSCKIGMYLVARGVK